MFANKGTVRVSEEVDFLLHSYTKETRNFKVKEEMERLRQLGIEVRTGPWTNTEDQILTHNWNNYIQMNPEVDPYRLLRIAQFEDKSYRKKLRKIMKDTHFNQSICKNLNRLVVACSNRATHLFNPYNRDPLSPGEIKTVKSMIKTNGYCWAKIGKELNRHPLTLCNLWRIKRDTKKVNKGYWTKSEKQQFIKSIKCVTGTKDLMSVGNNLDIQKISEGVPTRNVEQCRKHWLYSRNALIMMDSKVRIPKWRKKDDEKLIQKIFEMDITEELQIEWEDLLHEFPHCSSASLLKRKWSNIKSEMRNSSVMSFEEIRDQAFADLFI